MRNKKIQTFIKTVIEEGTSHTCALLHVQINDQQTLNLRTTIEQSILIEHKACGHSYEILFGDFLQNKKVCKVCTSAAIAELSDRRIAIKYSQHNTPAK